MSDFLMGIIFMLFAILLLGGSFIDKEAADTYIIMSGACGIASIASFLTPKSMR